jgi:hypothetical protein
MALTPSPLHLHENTETRGVSHCGPAVYINKYHKAKEEELRKLKYFTMPKYNLQIII